MSATPIQRTNATARLSELPDELTRLFELWKNPNDDPFEAKVAEIRDIIEDVRRALDVVEEIIKDDFYRAAQ